MDAQETGSILGIDSGKETPKSWKGKEIRKRIVRVSPIQAGKVLALFYGIISVPFALILMVVFAFSKGYKGPALLAVLILPFIYLIFGFFFTAIAAWLYNLIAKWTGGIEFESQEQPEV